MFGTLFFLKALYTNFQNGGGYIDETEFSQKLIQILQYYENLAPQGFFQNPNLSPKTKTMSSTNVEYQLVALTDLRDRLRSEGSVEGFDRKLNKINYSVGVDEIILNQTIAQTIVKKYGLAYDFYNINGYSLEMKYSLQSFSCFFLQSDPQMKIHVVRMWEDCEAFKRHAKEITLSNEGNMSLHDVFSFYRDNPQSRKSYDDTYCVDFGFFQYHFFPDGNAPEEYIDIESIAIKTR